MLLKPISLTVLVKMVEKNRFGLWCTSRLRSESTKSKSHERFTRTFRRSMHSAGADIAEGCDRACAFCS